jgi:cytochrome P450
MLAGGLLGVCDQRVARARLSTPNRAMPATLVSRRAGPSGTMLLGCLGQLRRSPLEFLSRCALEYGDVARFRVGPWRGVLLSHPESARYVLDTNSANYSKDNIHYQLLRPVAGDGLLTSQGARWRRNRQVVQRVFHSQRMRVLAEAVTEATEAMVPEWRALARRGEPVDAGRAMAQLTIRVSGRVLLAADLDPEIDAIDRAFTQLNRRFGTWSLASFVPQLPTPGNRRARAAVEVLNRVAARVVAERRRLGVDDGVDDAVSVLLRAQAAGGREPLDDQALRDELVTLLVAGYETTASCLTWTCYLLARHEAVQARVHDELDGELRGRTPGLGDLPAIPYTRAVLLEAMRLYPPVWIMSRTPIADDEVGGRAVRAGSLVFVSPWVMHHLPALWERAEAFEPERFVRGPGAAAGNHAYIPFGGGPRACIGSRFAVAEGHLVLANMAQRFAFRTVDDAPVEPDPLVTLRPRGEVRLLLRERHA